MDARKPSALPDDSHPWPRASFPPGISPADGWRRALEHAEGYVAEVIRCSVPVGRQYGCAHRDALLALVRRGLSSSNTIELEATRDVLRFAQEAMVRFHDHPLMAGARARYLGEDADDA